VNNFLFNSFSLNAYAGGFIGQTGSDENMTFILNNNINRGSFLGSPIGKFGGFIGSVYGTAITTVMENNVNYVDFNLSSAGDPGVSWSIDASGYVATSSQDGSIIMNNNTNDGSFFINGYDSGSVGGFLGDVFCSNLTLQSNTGNTNFFVDSSLNLGGIVGYYYAPYPYHVLIQNNTNNGVVSCSGSSFTIYNAGLFGMLYIPGGTQDKPSSVRVLNNINNGNVLFKNSDKESSYSYAGGLFGMFGTNNVRTSVFENNTNNGSFEGSSESGMMVVGGIIGSSMAYSGMTLCNNTNNGSINVSRSDNENKNCFAAGIVGFELYSIAVSMTDCANYGNLVSKCIGPDVGTCGLVCANTTLTTVEVHNCVNNGNVAGTKAYGISNMVTIASSIVSIGGVDGSTESYTFWEEAKQTPTHVYGLYGSCVNCDASITLCAMNESDGRYHSVDGDHSTVDFLLNSEAVIVLALTTILALLLSPLKQPEYIRMSEDFFFAPVMLIVGFFTFAP